MLSVRKLIAENAEPGAYGDIPSLMEGLEEEFRILDWNAPGFVYSGTYQGLADQMPTDRLRDVLSQLLTEIREGLHSRVLWDEIVLHGRRVVVVESYEHEFPKMTPISTIEQFYAERDRIEGLRESGRGAILGIVPEAWANRTYKREGTLTKVDATPEHPAPEQPVLTDDELLLRAHDDDMRRATIRDRAISDTQLEDFDANSADEIADSATAWMAEKAEEAVVRRLVFDDENGLLLHVAEPGAYDEVLRAIEERYRLAKLDYEPIAPGVSLLHIEGDVDRMPTDGASQLTRAQQDHLDRVPRADSSDAGSSLYVDVAAILSGSLSSPKPTIGLRADGEPFIYAAAVNIVFGPPESGKTLALSAIAADVLYSGGSVLWIDIDHNGAPATIARMRSFGVPVATLSDPARFRLALPEDKDEVLAVVKDAATWLPTLVAVDSIGELLPMFGANSNSDDDYTATHRAVLSRLAVQGAAVVGVDHEAKGQASRDFGAGGAVAKKRAVDGVMLRSSVRIPFTPGRGGVAALTIVKDRHGAVRSISPSGDKEPLATTFELTSNSDVTDWKFTTPQGAPQSRTTQTDIEILRALEPRPSSIYDVKKRLKWGSDRAKRAFEALSADAA